MRQASNGKSPGWSIGEPHEASAPAVDRSASDATSLYDKLERCIAPMFYREPDRYADVMLHAIALNGPFFNTQRMLQEYVAKAYLRQTPASRPAT